MKLDFAQNWQNGTKNRPHGPPGVAETEIFGVMGLQPPSKAALKRSLNFLIFMETSGTLILAHCVKQQTVQLF